MTVTRRSLTKDSTLKPELPRMRFRKRVAKNAGRQLSCLQTLLAERFKLAIHKRQNSRSRSSLGKRPPAQTVTRIRVHEDVLRGRRWRRPGTVGTQWRFPDWQRYDPYSWTSGRRPHRHSGTFRYPTVVVEPRRNRALVRLITTSLSQVRPMLRSSLSWDGAQAGVTRGRSSST